MAQNGKIENQNGRVSNETVRELLKIQRIGNAAVRKAQEENCRLGVPNWYSINGVIISDQQIAVLNNKIENSTDSTESTDTDG